MVFNGHPDTISIRVVLVPTIEDVTVVLDTSKRIMGKSRCHEHIFINAFEVFGEEFLHSTCAIYLGVDYNDQKRSFNNPLHVVETEIFYCKNCQDILKIYFQKLGKEFQRTLRYSITNL